MIDLIGLTPNHLTINIGFVIISVAILIHRTKRQIKVNESFIDIISFKQSIMTALAGGAITLTATNVISLVGVMIASIAVFLSVLQYFTSKNRAKEAKRANDISDRRLLLDEKKLNWEMSQDKKEPLGEPSE